MAFGKLTADIPDGISRHSTQKVVCSCSCGKKSSVKIVYLFRGDNVSCGRCNRISSQEIAQMKFGRLRIKIPQDVYRGSYQKLLWVCDCGREALISVISVMRNTLNPSCGRCNEITAEEFRVKQFSHLTLENPENLLPGSGKKKFWKCSCGNRKEITIRNVVSGRTRSCGQCNTYIRQKFKKIREAIRLLKTPIRIQDIPGDFIRPLETIQNTKTIFRNLCPICQKEYAPCWHHIRRGIALTCGCQKSRTSIGHQEIFDFITHQSIPAELEYAVSGWKYDIYVPSSKLLIEYDGLRWHSGKEAATRNFRKYQDAIQEGYSYLAIFEDEWIFHRSEIENLLRNRLGINPIRTVDIQSCEIRCVSTKQVNEFYQTHHLVGRARATVNLGMFCLNELVAFQSYRKLPESSLYSWELVNMTSKAENTQPALFRMFLQKYEPRSVVSFSDNRFCDGRIYERLGFHHDGDLRPDYYWWRNGKRFKKHHFRKDVERDSKLTETELREAQGYRKIWDLGKKRWVFIH